jgi:hypothetical protein
MLCGSIAETRKKRDGLIIAFDKQSDIGWEASEPELIAGC